MTKRPGTSIDYGLAGGLTGKATEAPIPLHRFPMTKYEPTDSLPGISGN